jgi:predicted AlkP superfamily pyrophosphatase or phosphodiesterase
MKLMRNPFELATSGFSELIFPVFPTTSRVAVGLLNTGKYGQHGWIVGDCRG